MFGGRCILYILLVVSLKLHFIYLIFTRQILNFFASWVFIYNLNLPSIPLLASMNLKSSVKTTHHWASFWFLEYRILIYRSQGPRSKEKALDTNIFNRKIFSFANYHLHTSTSPEHLHLFAALLQRRFWRIRCFNYQQLWVLLQRWTWNIILYERWTRITKTPAQHDEF